LFWKLFFSLKVFRKALSLLEKKKKLKRILTENQKHGGLLKIEIFPAQKLFFEKGDRLKGNYSLIA